MESHIDKSMENDTQTEYVVVSRLNGLAQDYREPFCRSL